MRKLSLFAISAFIIATAFYSCKSSDDGGVIIQGKVINQQTREPIIEALVQVSSPDELSNTFTRTDSAGNYSLGALEIIEITDLTLTVSAPNFQEVQKPLKVTPKDKVTGFNFELSTGEEGGSDDGEGGGDDTPSGPSGGAARIVLSEISEETIHIAETGGKTSSLITFEVQDSSGNSLDIDHAVDVHFSITSGPGGGESITPEKVRTDAKGLAKASLNSGNIAGVVKIEARIERTVPKIAANAESKSLSKSQKHTPLNEFSGTQSLKKGMVPSSQNAQKYAPRKDIVITSEPVAITIHGGFPDAGHFHITANSVNHEYKNGLEIPISVQLGDEFSNPVKPNTAVYFSTSNNIIEGSAKGHTNETGRATVNFTPTGIGSTTVTATTVDKNDQNISQSIDLLLTSSKAIINTSDEVGITKNEKIDLNYVVTDKNGNPMAPETSIEVSTEAALTLSGRISTVLGEELTGGDDITNFKFGITAKEEFTGSDNIIITVTSPSGVVTKEFITVTSNDSGEGGGGSVPGTPEAPASMELVSLSSETINIAESGGVTNTSFTFQVQDSAGRNLDAQSQAEVAFSILANPGGANITPSTATTDAQGRVTSNLNAGNTAGVVQIQAQIVGTNIKSKPVAVTVHGGFPDANHFTLEPLTDTNIEGFNRNGVEINYKVRLGDEFSNPVKPGTAVYFETDGGVIQGSGTGHTDEDGYAEVTLFAGNPRPANGKGTVTATTTDKNGNTISENTPFIFSTSKADISTGINELTLSPGSKSSPIDYTVLDLNANPMAAGTKINVTATGTGLQLSGDTQVTLSNELAGGTGITDFNFTVTANDNFSGSEKIIIQVVSPSGVVTTNKDLSINGTGGGVSGPPAGAASLILENVQRETINIKETGGIVNTAFTFQVQDSSGRPLNMDNPVDVDFEIINGPGGGEGVLPEKAATNSTGRVTSNLFSGNKAGVVMLQATITRADIGLTLRSKPVAITIHGGFPDLDHFSIAATKYNFGGYDYNGIENTIEVIVGDKFSNPVKPGTAVYFETTGGIIEGNGIGHTDDQGRVSVKLISGDPRPSEAETVGGTPFGGREGLAKITAKTINENNVMIEKSANVVFSTNSALISATPTTFDLQPNGGASFDYTITDLNGNPMPAGTEVSIKAGDGIEVTGSGNFKMGDNLFPGPQATEFSFSIRDTDNENNDPADLTILISVTAPNGNVTTYDGISGTRRKTIPKKPGSNNN